MKFSIHETLFRILYWLVSKVDKNAEILLMNFGYSDDVLMPQDNGKNEREKYSVNLYHHLAVETELKDKDIVEIGCGRGGGLAYITTTFHPASAIGIDLEKEAVKFCNRHYKIDGMSFAQGDAQNLNMKDASCDVVFNVESSHRYPDMQAFLGQVNRILRPGGYFLLTDFRYDYEMEDLRKMLNSSGLSVLKERIINKHVVEALEKDDARRRKLVERLLPKFLHKTGLNFSGTIGSETYNQFVSGKYVYFSYVLRKN
jgi:ubiquinone/menaquinone biosynthesis C-methylase UbiE